MNAKHLITLSLAVILSLTMGGCLHKEKKATPPPKVSKLKGKAIEVATEAARKLVEPLQFYTPLSGFVYFSLSSVSSCLNQSRFITN